MLNKYLEDNITANYCGYCTKFEFRLGKDHLTELDKVDFNDLPEEACFAKLFRKIRTDFGSSLIKDKPIRVKLSIFLTSQKIEQSNDNLCIIEDIDDVKEFINYFQDIFDYKTTVELVETEVGHKKHATYNVDITFNTWRNYGNDVRFVLSWIRYLYESPYRYIVYDLMKLKNDPTFSKLGLFNTFLLMFERFVKSGNSGHYISRSGGFMEKEEIKNILSKNTDQELNSICPSVKSDYRNLLLRKISNSNDLADTLNQERLLKRSIIYKAALSIIKPREDPVLVYTVGQRSTIGLILSGGYDRFLYNYKRTDKIEEANIIIFTGGEDVSPSLYKKAQHKSTYCNLKRDLEEVEEFKKIREDQLVVGICRGSQFLCVMNGGILVQDCNNHAGTPHPITSIAGNYPDNLFPYINFEITSTHHQIQYPYDLPKEVYTKLYTSYRSTKFEGEGINPKVLKKEGEPEIILYHRPGFPRCLAIQGHPEAMDKDSSAVKIINSIINLLLQGESL